MIRLRAGQMVTDQVVSTLQEVLLTAGNVRGSTTDTISRWAYDAEAKLRHLLPSDEMDRLVLTSRCRAVLSNPAADPSLARSEMDAAEVRWAEELEELKAWRQRWRIGDTVVAPDTNILLHHPQLFTAIDWHSTAHLLDLHNVRVVLPMVVVDELDRLKDNLPKGPTKTRARECTKVLADLFVSGSVDGHRSLSHATAARGWATLDILPDPPAHRRLPRPDDEIVDRLVALRASAQTTVIVLTYDFGMSFRARRAGLTGVLLERPTA